MSLIQNERTKLTATWLNTLGSAAIVVGVVTPAAGAVYGLAAFPTLTIATAIGGLCFTGAGIGLHVLARGTLGRLTQ